MAKKPAAAPEDDFSLDDMKLEGMGLDDQALFADLDNEMKLNGEAPAAAKKPASAKGKPPAKPEADDLMDLELDVTDAGAPDKPGMDDTSFDLNLEEGGKSDELDLDLGSGEKDQFDLDIGDVSGGGAPSDDILDAPDEAPAAGDELSADGDLNLDGDLDLNLDGVKSNGGDLELDGMDLQLDDARPEADASGMDDVTLDLDGEKESPDEPAESAEVPGMEDLELSLDGDSAEPLDSRLAEPFVEEAAPKSAGPTGADAMLEVDSLPGAGEGEMPVEPQEFQAVPDVNLDEMDLDLDMPAADPELPQAAAMREASQPMRMQGEARPAPFVAVQDTAMPQGDVLELNLADLDETPTARHAATAPAASATSAAGSILLSVPHQIQVRIGTVSLLGRDILDLSYGSVVQLNRSAGEPVDLMLEGNRIAQGEIVLINGKNIGVRIVSLGN